MAQTPVPTPPTPLPTKPPSSEPLGVRQEDFKAITTFKNNLPGQPQEEDPKVIRTIDDALNAAFRRSPSILQAVERGVRTDATLRQIIATQGPQISASTTYTRLSGSGAAFSGSGSSSPYGSVQNPFGVGLTGTPPGSQSVTLSSGNSTTNTGTNTTITPAGGSGQSTGTTSTAGATRAATLGSNTIGRQTGTGTDGNGGTSDDPGNTGGNQSGNNNNTFGSGGTNLNQASARIGVSWLIDIAGVVRTAQQIGDLEKALNRLQLAQARQEVALSVKNGYYGVLRAQAFVRVNEAAVAQSEEQLRVTEAQQRAGVASEFDVLRARTQLENNRQALISSRNQLSISKNSFANSLGIDPSTPIELVEPELPPTPALDETSLVTTAYERRPEILQADVNILKADKNIRLARRNLDPYLTFGISGQYNITQQAVGNEKTTGSASVTLGFPLNDGGSAKAAQEAARSDARVALVQKDQYARGIKSEVQQAVIAIQDARDRQEAAGQTVVQAREALRLANVRYRAGVGTQLEINDAQTALTQAETNLVNAQYDYLSALARLARATGEPQ